MRVALCGGEAPVFGGDEMFFHLISSKLYLISRVPIVISREISRVNNRGMTQCRDVPLTACHCATHPFVRMIRELYGP